jgi:DNA-binding transcriptional regulator YiaG
MTPRDIRQLRDRLGLEQTELARVLRVTSTQVSRLERGVSRPGGPLSVLLELLAEDPALAARLLIRRRAG